MNGAASSQFSGGHNADADYVPAAEAVVTPTGSAQTTSDSLFTSIFSFDPLLQVLLQNRASICMAGIRSRRSQPALTCQVLVSVVQARSWSGQKSQMSLIHR